MRNCVNTKFVAAAQQIRIHDSTKLTLHVYPSTAVIIENCSGMRVAPYRIAELGIGEIIDTSFDIGKYLNSNDAWNQCTKIQDFDCVVGESPNWLKLQESEWIQFQLKI